MKLQRKNANSRMYHGVGLLFLLAALVDKNVVYCAIGACFIILGVWRSKKERR